MKYNLEYFEKQIADIKLAEKRLSKKLRSLRNELKHEFITAIATDLIEEKDIISVAILLSNL